MAKGFDLAAALGSVSNPDTGREQIEYIDIDLLDEDGKNFYSLDGLDALAANIELIGLQQPLRVRPSENAPGRFVIVSGHRRRAALRKLVDDGREDLRSVACIRESAEGSEAWRELRLIYANSDTRRMNSADIQKQAARIEELLYKLKEEEGFEFPGRMRDHVAEICKVSKTKLARLKAIDNHLIKAFRSDYEKGTLSEATAYVLSQMPEEHQAAIWGAKGGSNLRWFYEHEAERFKKKLAAVDKCKCSDKSPCSNIARKRERVCSRDDYSDRTYCAKCCQDCPDFLSCSKSCSKLSARKGQLKANARSEKKRQELLREEAERPQIDRIKAYWKRFGEARVRAKVSVETVCKAMHRYYDASSTKGEFLKYEQGDGGFNVNTDIPLTNYLSRNTADNLVAAADCLGCSLDYLLLRTDDPNPCADSWTDAKEQPPREGSFVLAGYGYGLICPAVYWQSKFRDWTEKSVGNVILPDPDYWMPAPHLPGRPHFCGEETLLGIMKGGNQE